MNELLAIPISPREIVVTSTGWSDLRWVEVSFAHVIDMEFNHVYRTEFKSKNDIEWTVQYRFKHYRSLHHALETQGVILEAPFPRTYLRSSFGFALGIGQLRRRASRLHAVREFQMLNTYCFN